MASYVTQVETIIASGASLGAVVDCAGRVFCGIDMPAAWTAASLTFFAASAQNGTFKQVYRPDGSEYVVTVAASTFVPIPPLDFAGVRYLKIQSGVNGATVNQSADRTLLLSFKDA